MYNEMHTCFIAHVDSFARCSMQTKHSSGTEMHVCCVWMEVMMVLLEEERAESKSLWKPRSQLQNLSFSDGSLQLNTRLPFLYGTMSQPFPRNCRRKWPEIVFFNHWTRFFCQVAASARCTSPRCRGSPWCRSTAPQRSPALCVWTAAPLSASGTSGSRPGRRKSSSTSRT